ncbi:hypothetical protein ILUMI_12534 [Ignelater luminosus]|uniref:Uncharacterized protein n=1 Tax=Ignelater luminosus TaxID=2038154 RepID=A0A8K0GBP9_IGNLU|nr:hypothetical protein ILUMI_12534 [Ignelater luminosus]
MTPLNRDNAIRAVTLLQERRSQQYVANLLGVNQSTISRLSRRLRETGDVRRRPGQGRKRATSNRSPHVHTINQLLEALQEEREDVDSNFVQTVIESMPRRLQVVIRARGSHTRY